MQTREIEELIKVVMNRRNEQRTDMDMLVKMLPKEYQAEVRRANLALSEAYLKILGVLRQIYDKSISV